MRETQAKDIEGTTSFRRQASRLYKEGTVRRTRQRESPTHVSVLDPKNGSTIPHRTSGPMYNSIHRAK